MTVTESKHPTENFWIIEGKDDDYPYIFQAMYLGAQDELCLELTGFNTQEWSIRLVHVAERVIVCALKKAGDILPIWSNEPPIDIVQDKASGVTVFSGEYDEVACSASVRDDCSYVDRLVLDFDGGGYTVATVRGMACMLRRARQHMEL